jgi:hypothetical protein
MMVFWECDGLRSVAALPATGEETLEVYIWILATSFERGRSVCDGDVIRDIKNVDMVAQRTRNAR